MTEIDPNKVMTGVINKQSDDVLARAKSVVGDAREKLKARFKIGSHNMFKEPTNVALLSKPSFTGINPSP